MSLTLNNQMVALMSNSNEINSACLTLFFSYDYFDVFLKCLQDYKPYMILLMKITIK